MIEELIDLIIDDINRKNNCTEGCCDEIVDNNDIANNSIQDKINNNNSKNCKGDF